MKMTMTSLWVFGGKGLPNVVTVDERKNNSSSIGLHRYLSEISDIQHFFLAVSLGIAIPIVDMYLTAYRVEL